MVKLIGGQAGKENTDLDIFWIVGKQFGLERI